MILMMFWRVTFYQVLRNLEGDDRVSEEGDVDPMFPKLNLIANRVSAAW